MKATVQILANSQRSEFAPQPGRKANARHTCQCVVLGQEIQVGVLKIYENVAETVLVEVEVEGKKTKVIPAGAYELEYGLAIGWDDKELKGTLKSIIPIGKGNSMLAALGQAATPVAPPAK